MANHVLRCAMYLLILASSAQARWGAKSGGDKNSEDLVHELTSATFNLTLAAAPATWAMVEFYAHWYVHEFYAHCHLSASSPTIFFILTFLVTLSRPRIFTRKLDVEA